MPICADHLVAVVATAHPFAGRPTVSRAQLAAEHLITAAPDHEPAVTAHLRTLAGPQVPDHVIGARAAAEDPHREAGVSQLSYRRAAQRAGTARDENWCHARETGEIRVM